METDEFDSELGKITVTESFIERHRSESDEWKEIEEDNSAGELIDKAHFSEIEEVGVQLEARNPYLQIRTSEGWKRLYVAEEEVAEDCFKTLRYRWSAYQQLYQ